MTPQTFAAGVFGATLLVIAILIGMNHKAAESRRLLLKRRITRSRHARVSAEPAWVFERELNLGPVGDWITFEISRSGVDVKPVQILLVSVGLACVALLGGVVLGPVTALIMGGILSCIPFVFLRMASTAAEHKMLEQLPSAIDSLIADLRAGGTFERALRRTSQEVNAPLGEQFASVSQKMLVGIELSEALRGLSERFPNFFELRQLIGLIILQQRTGGDLIAILGNQRDAMRESITMRARMKAASSEARTSVKVLMTLPVLSIVGTRIVSPGYHDPLLELSIGRMVFAGSAMWMVLGLFLMANLVKRTR